jgi:hypothetical protein
MLNANARGRRKLSARTMRMLVHVLKMPAEGKHFFYHRVIHLKIFLVKKIFFIVIAAVFHC